MCCRGRTDVGDGGDDLGGVDRAGGERKNDLLTIVRELLAVESCSEEDIRSGMRDMV